jgi:hypothetical protein
MSCIDNPSPSISASIPMVKVVPLPLALTEFLEVSSPSENSETVAGTKVSHKKYR